MNESTVMKRQELDKSAIRITKWSFADDGKAVKVYIDAEQEPKAVAAASKESGGSNNKSVKQ